MRILLGLALALLATTALPSATAEKECPLIASWDISVGIEDWRPSVVLPQGNDDPRCWTLVAP